MSDAHLSIVSPLDIQHVHYRRRGLGRLGQAMRPSRELRLQLSNAVSNKRNCSNAPISLRVTILTADLNPSPWLSTNTALDPFNLLRAADSILFGALRAAVNLANLFS
jgi:hypothetical protein